MTAAVMVAIECTCQAFLLVVLTAYIVLPRTGSLKKDAFFYCLIFLLLGLTFDMISWACECRPSAMWLQYSSNTLCLILSAFINSFFSFYITGLVREKKPVSWLYAKLISAVNMGSVLVIAVAAVCGKLFILEPHSSNPEIVFFESGGLFYDLPNLLSTISLIILYTIVLRNAKVLGKNQTIVFSIYFLLPLFAVCLEMIDDNLQFSYAVTSICLSIVYMMLQSKHINELLVREKMLNEWSYVDTLTNLLNRRAFDRDMEAAAGDPYVSVAFCDLNGLKQVNDKKGHQAGDHYLISFMEMLTGHFSHDNVYRISGDEFVVLARGMSEEDFDRRIRGLRQDIRDNATIAALGTSSGPGINVYDLLNEAETEMYDDKERYYQMNPGSKRRHTDS